MFKKRESTRLGEILVHKGIITHEQLAIATHEQTKRKRLLKASASDATGYASRATLLGEILIELGFIDQLELKRGLNWQERLRHLSIAMALCAPFMTFLPNTAAAQTASSSSSTSINLPKNLAPTTIQAEDYSLMSGVSNEATTDVGGGKNVRYIDTNDWMIYANSGIYIPVTGTYQITFRVASMSVNGILALKEMSTDATLDTIPIPNTGKLQTWVDVVRNVTLTQGTHTFKLFAINGSFNINWFRVEPAPTPTPLTIQAESYSAMSGVTNESTTDTGGGKNVGYIDALDSMTYNNVDVVIPTTASYKITFRAASLLGGSKFTLGEAGTSTVLDTVTVPKTGGWQNWVNVERTVTLTAGKHNFAINSINGGFNLNWFKIEPASSSTTASSTSSSALTSSAPASVASSSAAVSSAPARVVSSSSSSKSSIAVSSSQAIITSSSSSSKPAMSSSSSKSSIPALSTLVNGPVGLSWSVPKQRENGKILDINELGGYELRYKLKTEGTYSYITINDPWISQYYFSWLNGEYVFQIAAFDKNGVYSMFSDIQPL